MRFSGWPIVLRMPTPCTKRAGRGGDALQRSRADAEAAPTLLPAALFGARLPILRPAPDRAGARRVANHFANREPSRLAAARDESKRRTFRKRTCTVSSCDRAPDAVRI